MLAEGLYREEIVRLVELARAGRRPYLRRTFDDINVSPLFLSEAVLPWLDLPFTLANRVVPAALRDLMTRFPVVPFRNPDSGAPRPRRPGVELRSELLSSLDGLRALLAANVDLDFREMVLEHPLIGVNHVPRVLAFLAQHERRHHRQIDGIRSERKFPTTGSSA
jgi:hypothetical protein